MAIAMLKSSLNSCANLATARLPCAQSNTWHLRARVEREDRSVTTQSVIFQQTNVHREAHTWSPRQTCL